MGLVNLILGQNAATPWGSAISQFTDQNRGMFGALGAGLGAGPSWQEGLAKGAENMGKFGQEQAELRERMAPVDAERAEKAKALQDQVEKKSQTVEWLYNNGHAELARLVEAGMDANVALAKAWESGQPGYGPDPVDPTSTPEGRQKLGLENGLVGRELAEYVLTGDLSTAAGGEGAEEFGVVPIWGKFPDGTEGYGVQGNRGSFKRPDLGGFQPLGPYDLNANKSAGRVFGSETGAAQFDVPSAQLTMNETLGAIQEIRANTKGKEEQFSDFGPIPQQMTPAWPKTEKANFRNSVSRAADQAFLQAREMLRGGGQITDFEGRKAENAITNMKLAMESGSSEAFDVALADFEKAVTDGYNKLVQQASVMPSYGQRGAQPSAGGGGTTSTGVPWSIEQ